ncbi:MAG: hypothetical protein P8I94_04455, partial [Emcibacteraceae bacterium]|nr:hypothetical protein [Emcibacteraceae bacterium]
TCSDGIHKRTSIELFYREPLTKEIIKEDANGRFKNQIRRFINVLDCNGSSELKDFLPSTKEQSIHLNSIKEYKAGSLLLYKLLLETPIFDGTKFDLDIEYTSKDLKSFVRQSISLSSYIETQLDIQTQSDIASKPTQHLGKFLKLIGLKPKKCRTKTSNNKKTYIYKLDADRLHRVLEIAERQTKTNSSKEMDIRYGTKWTYMNKLHGFKYDLVQINWLCPGFDDSGKPYFRRKDFGYQKWATDHGLTDTEPHTSNNLIDLFSIKND